MSIARKCDACGALFEINHRRRIEVFRNYHPYPQEREFDFCDSCYKKLCEFIHEKPDDEY